MIPLKSDDLQQGTSSDSVKQLVMNQKLEDVFLIESFKEFNKQNSYGTNPHDPDKRDFCLIF